MGWSVSASPFSLLTKTVRPDFDLRLPETDLAHATIQLQPTAIADRASTQQIQQLADDG
jgi:hypothetical protein